ncbi:hypothetical protein [Novosphingobium sp. Chol11]|uniref:hypothetical protein n=1 Tax=Novosphingobium sp. Chol11 TaxID=1385763 RepID=UPI0025EB02E3|nr:hypothetical protein [Novosphingobium sp. Chol11]
MRILSSLLSARSAIPVLAIALLALGGCASANRSRFPSLERRAAERQYGTALPVTANTGTSALLEPLPASAGLAARVSALRERAQEAHRAFAARQSAATRLAAAARGAKPGSEAWSAAQVALAGLDSARSEGMISMADLDRLLIAASEAAVNGDDADLALVRSAHAEVQRLLSEEDSVIAELRDRNEI